MKELELYEALPIIREELGKDSITILELNMWVIKYQKEHPDIYVNNTRLDIGHAHECNYIWWEIRNEGSDILHKQESLNCPCCGEKIYKYPNTEHFENVKKMEN